MKDASFWVKQLDLLPHPEGGFYKETYRSEEIIEKDGLPDRFEGARHHSTGIFYLLENPHFSGFHRIKSDEMWHFHTGSLLIIYVIHPDGRYEEIHLGDDIQKGRAVSSRCSSWELVCFTSCC